MTETERAYYCAQAYQHTLEAEADGAKEKVERLNPFEDNERRRAWTIGLHRHMAAWHRAMSDYWAACAMGTTHEVPGTEDYPDFEELGEGAGVESTQACAPVAVIEPGGRAA